MTVENEADDGPSSVGQPVDILEDGPVDILESGRSKISGVSECSVVTFKENEIGGGRRSFGPVDVVESGRSKRNPVVTFHEEDVQSNAIGNKDTSEMETNLFESSSGTEDEEILCVGDNKEDFRKHQRARSIQTTIKDKYGSVIFEYDEAMYPADCYSILSLYGPIDKPWFFLFGMLVFSTQMIFLVLMILSKIHPTWKTGTIDDNPADRWVADLIATESSPLVRAAQIMSLFTYLFFADASLADMIKAIHTFPRFSRSQRKDKIGCMIFSCSLRFIQGFLAMVVAIILVIASNDVIDIILNFTALNFISALDEVAFEFAKSGKYGPKLEAEVKKIEKLPLPCCMFRKYKHIRYRYTVSLLGLLVSALLIGTFMGQITNTGWDTQVVRIQFTSEDDQPYNGCYEKNDSVHHAWRDTYISNAKNEKNATLGFCVDEKRWYLYKGNASDPCEANQNKNDIIIRSSRTDSFDISASAEDDWYTGSGTPADVYFFEDGELSCSAFLNDGICDENFNSHDFDWDQGDCCVATCTVPMCNNGGLTDAFGTKKTYGDGYSDCKDPNMFPLTIQLNGFISSRDPEFLKLGKEDETYVKKFWKDFWDVPPSDTLITMYCDGKKVLKFYIDNTMENQTETVKVNDQAECEIQITNNTNSQPEWDDEPIWYVNYAVYHGDHDSITDNPTLILQEFSAAQGVSTFERIPSCYMEKLEEHINRNNVYIGNDPSSKAIDWLMKDKSEDSNCMLEHFTSRYALAVMNFAARAGEKLWISYDNQCTWPNMACTGTLEDSVLDQFHLDLSGIGLSGFIATEIGLLDDLDLYDVSNNNLTSSIPTEIGKLGGIQNIDLSKNVLTGPIPIEIKNLTIMSQLRMGTNELNGSIPTEIGLLTALTKLDLEQNKFVGSIPTEIGLLKNLTSLRLHDNQLTGLIPTEVGLLTSLTFLGLFTNGLEGTIPGEIRYLKDLTALMLGGNSLTGTMPTELGLLTHLTWLGVANNNNISGSIPTEIENLTNLERLYILNTSIPGDCSWFVGR